MWYEKYIIKYIFEIYLLIVYGGRIIRKLGILIVLLLAGIIFISGCAEDTQEEETGAEEERVTPVEEVALTEGAEEPTDENADEGLVPGQEEESTFGEEGIIPGEEEPGLGDNETAEAGNQTIVQTAEAAWYITFASLVRDEGLENTWMKGHILSLLLPMKPLKTFRKAYLMISVRTNRPWTMCCPTI